MKLDSKLYKEAQKVARFPRLRVLMLGVICGAIVPTVYIRNYFIPRFRREALQDISDLSEQGSMSFGEGAARKTKPVMKLWPMLNAKQREHLMMKTSGISNDATRNGKGEDDDSAMVMFSSIM